MCYKDMQPCNTAEYGNIQINTTQNVTEKCCNNAFFSQRTLVLKMVWTLLGLLSFLYFVPPRLLSSCGLGIDLSTPS